MAVCMLMNVFIDIPLQVNATCKCDISIQIDEDKTN